jgi:phosphohistidine phosphatase SixA
MHSVSSPRLASSKRTNRLILLAAAFALFVHAARAESTIFIVRHAEKATGGRALNDPDLSNAGRARAKSLAGLLKDARITAVYATEFKRTQQTAAPTAAAARVGITQVPGKATSSLVAKLRALRGNALVVGHSNTVPEVIKALGFPKPAAIGDGDYDNLFLLVRSAPPQLIRLHYR